MRGRVAFNILGSLGALGLAVMEATQREWAGAVLWTCAGLALAYFTSRPRVPSTDPWDSHFQVRLISGVAAGTTLLGAITWAGAQAKPGGVSPFAKAVLSIFATVVLLLLALAGFYATPAGQRYLRHLQAHKQR